MKVFPIIYNLTVTKLKTYQDGPVEPEQEGNDPDDRGEEDEEDEGEGGQQEAPHGGQVALPTHVALGARDLWHGGRLPQLVAHAIHLVHHLNLQESIRIIIPG